MEVALVLPEILLVLREFQAVGAPTTNPTAAATTAFVNVFMGPPWVTVDPLWEQATYQ